LKILVSNYTHPGITNYTTILFKNTLPILKKTKDVHLFWAIHNNFSNLENKLKENETILKIRDFQNAVEMIEFVKPDLVFVIAGLSAPDYAFYLAAKFLKIPIIGGQTSAPFFKLQEKKELFKTYISQFFQSSSSDNNKTEIKGKKLWEKYMFMVNTMRSVNMSKINIIHEFLEYIIAHFTSNYNRKINSKFKCDKIFVDSENEQKKKIAEGYYINSLVVTGNPSYDKVINHIMRNKTKKNKNKKIRILFLTVNLEGQGGNWTKKKRNFMLKEFIRICSKENYEISIKIHPSGEKLDEYQNITKNFSSEIKIFQKDDLINCLENTDIVFSMSSSTAGLIALLLKKPMIIWNFFNVKNDIFLDNKLIIECKNIEKLPEYIKQILDTNCASKEILNKIISDILYKADGKASERITKEILKVIQK
jgi:UDP-N-acetylglucosamine 2-epimerase